MTEAPLPTVGEIHGREHMLPVRVYYEDTDFTGVVYHGTYVRYFERGRSDFLRAAGIHHAELLAREDPIAFAVTRIDIAFKRSARIDDALVVRTFYDAVRGPRLFISQQITRGGELIATAAVEAASIDLQGRPKRPPPGMTDILRPYFSPEQ